MILIVTLLQEDLYMTNQPPIQLFAKAIKRLRTSRNLSRNAFAKECGCSPNSVRSWEEETASPSLDHIWAISEAMGVSFDVVLGKDTTDEYVRLTGLTSKEQILIRELIQILRNAHN